ncbi:hypothetical protein HPB47_008079 [Ixodes persulcatus]|uniref:Uncharacterized protein n=1 Tax=Ixodes persulcatus TaxID=34615 RepID=A0AC60P5P8_IXOPE|nr:hypothetical protein HPB47_008079 [Ixodes persulcatus]
MAAPAARGTKAPPEPPGRLPKQVPARAVAPGATSQRGASQGAATQGPSTVVGTTTVPPVKGHYHDFADTLTSEIQNVGDQSQGMHDDPKQAYRTKNRVFIVIEIVMAVSVLALVLGTVVMLAVSSGSKPNTLRTEPPTTTERAAGGGVTNASIPTVNSTNIVTTVFPQG